MGRKILFTSIVLLIAICLSEEGFAQKSEVSIDIGYGNTITNDSYFILPFKNGDPFYQIGCMYMLTSKDSAFSFFGGMTLDSRNLWPHRGFDYLKVPIGMNLNFGRKAYFIFGGGINIGMLLTEQTYLNEFNKFTFGTFVRAGTSIRFSDKYRLMLSYQANFDVSVMYVMRRISFSGSRYEKDIKGDDRFLVLSLYKSIGNSTKNSSPVR